MAEKYFESSSQSGNNNALLSLGNMYYYGKGVKQNYVQGINYYKRASQLGNVKASLKLGIIYYNGKGIEFKIMISMNYYVSCINIEKRYNLFNSSYYYHANNDLGLIYLVEYQQEKLAEKYLSESGYNEYPIGQNSYGIFLQYCCHNENKAKQMFENASELYSLALS
ncbi:hypothetical protein M9Y10_003270 [Tritrichomonas musculus]|uniref:HCP-like protein n=1 Tax=Tritrichomonas musculus TaxID=1915356 RepID=A0ABR2JP12_9EUKA